MFATMRLLRVENSKFEEFYDNIPPYAIASHRWLADDVESTRDKFESGKPHAGREKIKNFIRFVQQHLPRIEWLWIDTCCIDHDSSQNVQDEMNGMFQHYRDARVCIAHLRDVPEPVISEEFVRGEWFRRGWTLQELIFPQRVIFVSLYFQPLGQKKQVNATSLSSKLERLPIINDILARITKIPKHVLDDYDTCRPLSFDDKMQWMSQRSTTKPEDYAYCLIGIMDVKFMTIAYNQGKQWAIDRLKAKFGEKLNEGQSQVSQSFNYHGQSGIQKSIDDRLSEALVRDRNLDVVQMPIAAKQPPINHIDVQSHTPLWLAACFGHTAIVRELLQTPEIDRRERDMNGESALWTAACNGQLDIVKILIADNRSRPNEPNNEHQTSLWIAACHGHAEIVHELLRTPDVDRTQKDSRGESPLWTAACNGRVDVVKALIADNKSLLNDPNNEGQTPLWAAACRGHEEIVHEFLRVPHVNRQKRDLKGESPLWTAACNGRMNIVKMLIADKKSQLNEPNNEGQTPLWAAACRGHAEIAKLLQQL